MSTAILFTEIILSGASSELLRKVIVDNTSMDSFLIMAVKGLLTFTDFSFMSYINESRTLLYESQIWIDAFFPALFSTIAGWYLFSSLREGSLHRTAPYSMLTFSFFSLLSFVRRPFDFQYVRVLGLLLSACGFAVLSLDYHGPYTPPRKHEHDSHSHSPRSLPIQVQHGILASFFLALIALFTRRNLALHYPLTYSAAVHGLSGMISLLFFFVRMMRRGTFSYCSIFRSTKSSATLLPPKHLQETRHRGTVFLTSSIAMFFLIFLFGAAKVFHTWGLRYAAFYSVHDQSGIIQIASLVVTCLFSIVYTRVYNSESFRLNALHPVESKERRLDIREMNESDPVSLVYVMGALLLILGGYAQSGV